MNHYLFEGVIKIIHDTQTFKNNFKKREIVLITDGDYPDEVKFEFIDENGIKALDNFIEGEEVTIAFLVKGNEYQGRHFVNLRGIAIGAKVVETNKKNKKTETVVKTKKAETYIEPSDDDLPF